MEKTDPTTNEPIVFKVGKDPRKLIVFLFILSLVSALSLLAYYNYFSSRTKYKEPRLATAYLSKTKLTEQQLFDQAREGCFEFTDPSKRIEYQERLKNDIFNSLEINNTLELLSIIKLVPQTSTCITVWVVDEDGIGVAGYRNTAQELVTAVVQANTFEIENIKNEIRNQGYEL